MQLSWSVQVFQPPVARGALIECDVVLPRESDPIFVRGAMAGWECYGMRG
jgi:hypothetical protein